MNNGARRRDHNGARRRDEVAAFEHGRLSRKVLAHAVFLVFAMAFFAFAVAWSSNVSLVVPGADKLAAALPRADREVAHRADREAPHQYVAVLDPTFSLGPQPVSFSQSVPLRSDLQLAMRQTDDTAETAIAKAAIANPAAVAKPVIALAPPVLPLPAPAPDLTQTQTAQSVPLPSPRPSELLARSEGPSRHVVAQQNEAVALSTEPAPEKHSLFEKLFGKPASTVLAYAAPDGGIFSSGKSITPGRFGPQTAVYDISSHTVYLPNGQKLEAHSGLGSRMDDPKYVHERMRGATPPHLYDLTLREKLFHGVQAIRLTPVDGEASIYGRTGLLAHTYMLGPNGQSNGCVSFRNYEAFLRAYQNGTIKQLAVVASL